MTTLVSLSRRRFLGCAGVASATLLTGCSTQGIGAFFEPVVNVIAPKTYDGEQPDPAVIYAARTDEGFSLPAIPYKNIPQRFYRQRVIDPTGEAPGTVVVDTKARYLYLVEKGGTAMRYGVSIGKEGFAWQGEGVIQWRKKWPRWTPPDEMVARQPKLARYSIANGGQEPGIRNPRTRSTACTETRIGARSARRNPLAACASSIRTSSISTIACPKAPGSSSGSSFYRDV